MRLNNKRITFIHALGFISKLLDYSTPPRRTSLHLFCREWDFLPIIIAGPGGSKFHPPTLDTLCTTGYFIAIRLDKKLPPHSFFCQIFEHILLNNYVFIIIPSVFSQKEHGTVFAYK